MSWRQKLIDWQALEASARGELAAEHLVHCGGSPLQARLVALLFRRGDFSRDPVSESTRSTLICSQRQAAEELGCSLGGLQRAIARLEALRVLRADRVGARGTRLVLSWSRLWGLRPPSEPQFDVAAAACDEPPPVANRGVLVDRATAQSTAPDRAVRRGQARSDAVEEYGPIVLACAPARAVEFKYSSENQNNPGPDPAPAPETGSALQGGAAVGAVGEAGVEIDAEANVQRSAATPRAPEIPEELLRLPEIAEAAELTVDPLPAGRLLYGPFRAVQAHDLDSVGRMARWHAQQLALPRPIASASGAAALLVASAARTAARSPPREIRSNRCAYWAWLVAGGRWKRVLHHVPGVWGELRRARDRGVWPIVS